MEAPFYVGQRVVAIADSRTPGMFKKGDVFTVKGLMYCCEWNVHFGDVDVSRYCEKCMDYLPGKFTWSSAKKFAPITAREVEIDEAIIEQAEEMVSVKETVLEPVLN